MTWELMILPFIGGIIGYSTNVLAIRMLFRPYDPIRIPLTPWFLQGLLPKRKDEIAANIGETVEKELLSLDQLEAVVAQGRYQDRVLQLLVEHVDQRVEENLPRLLPSALRTSVRSYVRDAVTKEAEPFMTNAYEQLWKNIRSDVRLGDMVREKVASLDLHELENLVLQVAKDELKHIEVLGAILGFAIGLVQMAFLWLRWL